MQSMESQTTPKQHTNTISIPTQGAALAHSAENLSRKV